MFAHVDQFGRLFDSAKGRFHRGIRTAHKRHHRSVRTRARIDIEQRNAVHRFNGIGDLPNDLQIAPLRKIRHAFNQLSHSHRISRQDLRD